MRWILLLWSILELGFAQTSVYLASDEWHTWEVHNSNGSVSIPATIPGTAHQALIDASLISDPFYRFNEISYQWIALENWTFHRHFAVPRLPVGGEEVELEIGSVDTVADVFLNQLFLGHVDDMHTRVRFSVPPRVLMMTGNILEVRITSSLTVGRAAEAAYAYPVPLSHYWNAWDDNGGGQFGGQVGSGRNFVRKTASDTAWDWGPGFVPQGIHGRIQLNYFTTRLRDDVLVQQDHRDDGSVGLVITLEVEASSLFNGGGVLSASLRAPNSLRLVVNTTTVIENLPSGLNVYELRMTVQPSDVELWWPVGYGPAMLYNLNVHFQSAGVVQNVSRRVGLRTVTLVTEPIASGETFYFEVNKVPIFAKGANVIPLDALDRDGDEDKIWLIESAVAANMNMLRVWGGGKFQTDVFYRACDEWGLMVWQEMMFGCAMYPTDGGFLNTVRTEVVDAVKRLQSHPSIVIWGGNNENEGAMEWYKESRDNRSLYQADYVKLYLDTVYSALRDTDPELLLPHAVQGTRGGRYYVDSSPSNGLSSANPYDKRWGDVSNVSYGDVHYYNYGADCEDPATYPKARFVSEHGFQSWPSYVELEHVMAPEDMRQDSDFVIFRQRHPHGNSQLVSMMNRHFFVPPVNATTQAEQARVFDAFLYLSQVQQARCYETAIGTWRRLKGDKTVRTMGVLYWQMNDAWPGPSWSSMEWDGRWRVVQYAVMNSYAPVALSSFVSTDGLVHVHVTSDVNEKFDRFSVRVGAHLWGALDNQPVHSWSFSNISLDRLESREVGVVDPASVITVSSGNYFMRLELLLDGNLVGEPVLHWLTNFREANLPPSTLRVDSVQLVSANKVRVTVSTNTTAPFTLLETDANMPGRFSANAFNLMPGESRSVTFEAKAKTAFSVTPLELPNIKVRSLQDAVFEFTV